MAQNHAQKEGIALFSGGYDSLVATHKTMELDGNADTVIHMDTGTGIPLNERFVEAVCNEYGWYLQKLRPKRDFWHYAKKYGFPGPSAHSWYYAYLKQHPLRRACKPYEDKPYLYTGVRKAESEKRMGRVVDLDEREFAKWKAPLSEWSDEEVRQYLVEHNLPRSPVVESIDRSGECYCMAYGIREFEVDLGHYEGEDEDPPVWLLNHVRKLKRREWEVQVYRGRVFGFLKEDYPDVFEEVNRIRDEQNRADDLRLDILRDYRPSVAEEVAGIPELKALQKGRQEEQAWLGHGKMSSEELRKRTMPENQEFLCEDCKDSTSNSGISHPDEDARLLVEPSEPDSGEQVGFDDL
jgi:3'-phosphoadenosine 5'-phosphosulfate sulfotransferase (PAPS reductase)/FAD synthetase